jgi:hypothetical protein
MDLTGKVVIVLNGQPEAFGADPNFYGSSTHKTDEAMKRGAVAVITLYAVPGGRGMRGGQRPRMTITGAHETAFNGVMTLDAVTADGGGDRARHPGGPDPAKAGGAFKAIDTGVTLNVDIDEMGEVIHSHNLLAKITGTTRPDEYLVYSAHWDHVGVGRRSGRQRRPHLQRRLGQRLGHLGRDGDGARLQGRPAAGTHRRLPARHGRGAGLLGSEWYATHPVYPLEKTAADINIDMLPFTPATKTIAIFGIGKSGLEDDLERLAQREGRQRRRRRRAGAGLLLPVGPLQLRGGRRAGPDALDRRRLRRGRRGGRTAVLPGPDGPVLSQARRRMAARLRLHRRPAEPEAAL